MSLYLNVTLLKIDLIQALKDIYEQKSLKEKKRTLLRHTLLSIAMA
jgi:hypothetical protein